ncbi:MAG: hypothetical protein FJX64_07910 [Alphaproteobacteria bacterium]|nr:hypothetical protein [Alphaproteobacteria bacterium]
MNTTANRLIAAVVLLAAAAGVLVAAPSANAQQGQRLAIAAAGSPLIVPATYVEGTLTRWDSAARTMVVNGASYPVVDAKIMGNISVGERVIVTVLQEHYGPAARLVAMGVERVSPGNEN